MTHTDQHTQSPAAPPGGRPRTRPVSLRIVLGSAIAVATVAGAAVLGVRTLAADDQTDATGRPPIAGQDDSRATQGSSPDGEPAGSATVSGRPWEDERFDRCVQAETRSRPMASSDDGLPNPWQAGSIAAKCYLLTDTSGAPYGAVGNPLDNPVVIPSTAAANEIVAAAAKPLVVADAYHGVGFEVCPNGAAPVKVADAYHGVGITVCIEPTCSIWSVPTLEVAPVPQSSLTEDVPYTAVCTDDADETTFVFLYGHDNHTPTPRR